MPEPVYALQASQEGDRARYLCPACGHQWEAEADLFKSLEALQYRSEVELDGIVMEITHMRCEQCGVALLPVGLFNEVKARATTEASTTATEQFGGYESKLKCPIKNPNNVRTYVTDIMKANDSWPDDGPEWLEQRLPIDDFRFFWLMSISGAAWDHLQTQGLLNRGFCPVCGDDQITAPHARPQYRRHKDSSAQQILCESCWRAGVSGGAKIEKAAAGGCASTIALLLLSVAVVASVIYF